MTRRVYSFGAGQTDGDPHACDPEVVGGKGASLAQMAAIGLPVPPGFTIAAAACAEWTAQRSFADDLRSEVAAALAGTEAACGRRFADPVLDGSGPLLVSVRSGARVSMPGMMDTVLNVGLSDRAVAGLAAATGDARFAWDCYRRLIQTYADVVLGLDRYLFEDALETAKEDKGYRADAEMLAGDWQALTGDYLAIVRDEAGQPFPQDPHEQLWAATAAVIASWDSERARVYRGLNAIPADWGTAVTVQAMVFGNLGDTSATGVAFTRDPATGAKAPYGEWLAGAQGEDIVAGLRTPHYLTRAARELAAARQPSMEEAHPQGFAELCRMLDQLERHYRDMQDIEFTIERGKLWLLQTRPAKRTTQAAVKIAVDMVAEGLIDRAEAVRRVDTAALGRMLEPVIDPAAPRDVLGRGLPASPGAATGAAVLDAAEAERRAALGEAVILVRSETGPGDIHGMHAARGVLTARGGMTSHAAVVARGMGRPCITGTAGLTIDPAARTLHFGARAIAEGETITIDGGSGEILAGRVAMIAPTPSGDLATLLAWAERPG